MGESSDGRGNAIRTAYRQSGMNRSQFQRAIGVAYSTVLNWERGITRPNAGHLERIASVTGVPLPELLRGSEPRTASSPPRRYAAFDKFLRATGSKLTRAERHTMESIVFVGIEPSVATFVAILVGLRMGAVVRDARDAAPRSVRRVRRAS